MGREGRFGPRVGAEGMDMDGASLSRQETAQTHFAAGQARLAAGDPAAAAEAFKRAIAANPVHAQSHLGMAVACRGLNDWTGAEAAARAALQADPGSAPAAHFLGALLVELDRLSEALPFLKAAADWAPDVAQHHRDLGVTQLFLGDIEGARARLIKTIELDVLSYEVLYTLVRMSRMEERSAEAEQLLGLIHDLAARSDELTPAQRAQVYFSLGKVHEDRREFEDAAKAMALANAVRRSSITYDISGVEAAMARIAEVFDKALVEGLQGKGDASERPIFIVGMPRSGSTLTEQILSAHPQVHGAGEIKRLPLILDRSHGLGGARYPDWAKTMNAADCRSIGQAYLNGLSTGLPGQTRTTDKWLDNFLHLGLINVCLPKAKIIHCVRDPRDQLLSCWALLFSQEQEYAYDLEELGRYYKAYSRLMTHWRSVLPAGAMLEVRYEDLITQPEVMTRRILAHCGLEWDDRTLRYWEAKRPVKSGSVFQVRQPLYDQSIGRWRPFAPYLRPLFEPFGLV
jgi:Tfp pilus assembly protein PilF